MSDPVSARNDAPTIVAVIPAYREAARVGETVRAVLGIAGVSRAIVVDDASDDDTGAIAAAAGADVVRHERNLGKGHALATGIKAAREDPNGPPDAVLLLDADLGASASAAAALLGPVATGAADMTVAVLPKPPGSGGFGVVLRLARWGVRRLGGWEPRAPLSGQRALNAAALHAMGDPAAGFGVEVAMTVRVLGAGLRVVEVEAPMSHAATGRDLRGFVHRGRQFADVARALATLALERRRPSA